MSDMAAVGSTAVGRGASAGGGSIDRSADLPVTAARAADRDQDSRRA